MSVFVLLRASLCLSLLIIAFSSSSSSSGVDFVPACRDICDVIASGHAHLNIHYVLCLEQCGDLSSSVDGNQEKIWKTTDVETPADGLEDAAVGKRKSNLLTSNFVRYGRDEAKIRKARRPIYIRVGRSGETAVAGEAFPSLDRWNGQTVMEKASKKRASRFIRIGKSDNDGFEDQAKNMGRGLDGAEFEKRNNILPSKYVRIGKRSDETE